MKSLVRIAPSLLSGDFARLGDEVTAAIERGAGPAEAGHQAFRAAAR